MSCELREGKKSGHWPQASGYRKEYSFRTFLTSGLPDSFTPLAIQYIYSVPLCVFFVNFVFLDFCTTRRYYHKPETSRCDQHEHSSSRLVEQARQTRPLDDVAARGFDSCLDARHTPRGSDVPFAGIYCDIPRNRSPRACAPGRKHGEFDHRSPSSPI